MPYVGEIRLFACEIVPQGWLRCDGSMLPVAQHQPLFNLIGNSYGGDGVTSFCVPNLAGRTVYCIDFYNNPTSVGQVVGSETVTLDGEAMPTHSHSVVVPPNEAPMVSGAAGTAPGPSAGVATLGSPRDADLTNTNYFYNSMQPDVVLNTGLGTPDVGNAGSASVQPISIMQPYLVLNYCICSDDGNGVWPQPGN